MSHAHAHGHGPGHSHGLVDASIKRSRAGLRVVGVALAVLAVTAAVQAVIYVASGSVALLADLIHNAGDALTAIPLGLAFLLRSERAERRAGLFVVGAIFVSACVAGAEAVDRLVHPQTPGALWVLAAAAGHTAFPHRGLDDGDEVDLGGLTVRALATPGHSPEHLSYLLLDGRQPRALFSGGSLLVRTPAARNMRSRPLPRATIVSKTALPPISALPPKTASTATAPWATGDHVTVRLSSAKKFLSRATSIGV